MHIKIIYFNSTKVQFGGSRNTNTKNLVINFNSTKVQFGDDRDGLTGRVGQFQFH